MSGAASLTAEPSRNRSAVVAAAVLVVLAVGLAFASRDILAGWLGAACLWAGLPMGALVVAMIMRLVPGVWTKELGPGMEAVLPALLPVGLAFLPVVIGAGSLYPWAGAAQRTAFRAVYLTVPFFAVRTVAWFCLAGGFAWLLATRRAASAALPSIGLILWALGGTVVATDWLQSLDPDFNSSGFGLYVLAGWTVIAMAAGVLAAIRSGPVEKPGVLGGLLLTALLIWGYLAFMQFVIIWSGNLPAGVRWYLERREGVWALVLWAYVLLQAVPLSLLILPPVMRSRGLLPRLASLVLAGKAFEFAWLVLPGRGPLAGMAYVAALVVIGAATALIVRTPRGLVRT